MSLLCQDPREQVFYFCKKCFLYIRNFAFIGVFCFWMDIYLIKFLINARTIHIWTVCYSLPIKTNCDVFIIFFFVKKFVYERTLIPCILNLEIHEKKALIDFLIKNHFNGINSLFFYKATSQINSHASIFFIQWQT